MDFYRVYEHLLPRGKAWNLTIRRNLSKLIEALAAGAAAVKLTIDLAWLDLFPSTTRRLTAWERQFGLRDVPGITEPGRRQRLEATWKALGGQSPAYIQSVLRDHGFDVYVHEWWEPGTEPVPGEAGCAMSRNPLTVIRRTTGPLSMVDCGDLNSFAGEPFAEAGNSIDPRGHLLVNKISRTTTDFIPACGEDGSECGEADIVCGNFETYRSEPLVYSLPLDSEKWPYFLYIGAPKFGELAYVPFVRKEEFETLVKKICPAHLWLGLLVEYK